MIPHCVLGERGGGRVWLVDSGFRDGTTEFDILEESLPIAPGGPDGEAVYHTLYLVLTHTMAATVRVTPIVEDAEKDTIDIELAEQSDSTRRIFELALSEGYTDPVTGQEEMRVALRGTWFTVRVETVNGLGSGDLELNALSVEAEVVTESRTAENAT